MVAIIKPGRDLATITEWDLQETNRHLRANLKVNKTALYIADLIHHMLTDHDPHLTLFDQLRETLDRMRQLSEVDNHLFQFQWNLLDETGYRPQLDHDAETGGELDDDVPTLAFSPVAGGVVADSGAGDRWRVRVETVRILRQVAAGIPLDSVDPSLVERGNRLLAAYFRELIGSEPAAMRWRFGELMGKPSN
ncbi:MAG: DNA repair protein RecO [Planctomycetes bacterium]|nr:DNA repair protein RecO [Planctomycetota bacterium]